jgi:hypothetical protein
MKKLYLVIILLFQFHLVINAQEKYSRVKVLLNTNITMNQLQALGLEVDHGVYIKSKSFETDLSKHEIDILKLNQIPIEILIDDVSKYYEERNNNPIPENKKTRAISCKPSAPNYIKPNGFNYGSMGGFFTYQEAMNKIDSLAILYPNIVSIKKGIGNHVTAAGDSIYSFKISDNPNANESEPQILFNALHHAREAASLSQLIFFMYYLCENYATNTEIKYLVDNIEIYFVPIINPDGYKYNHLTNPNGGGMWRKNRRDNLDGTFGVDPNRNYGTGWGFNNTGSSPNTSASTYRGPSAFSEPETKALRDFCNAHEFKFAMNYHTFSNLVVYPWGYLGMNCNDSSSYQTFTADMTKYNYYKCGTDMETVGYSTNGSSDDWMYGEVISKPLILAMTPEVGNSTDGFWPSLNRILPLCNETNYMNLQVCKYVLKYATLENQTPRLANSVNGFIKYNITRLGLQTPANFNVSLQSLNANVVAVGANKNYSSLNYATTILDSISYTLQNNIPANTEIDFLLTVNNGTISKTDTIRIIHGSVINLLTENCNNFTNWTNNGWAISNGTFAENVAGPYQSFYGASLRNSQAINLTDAYKAELTFNTTYQLENNSDYVLLTISTDGGNTWTVPCAPHTQPITNFQDEVYNGVKQNWFKEIINLDDYVGKNIILEWNFSSDQSLEKEGFNMDDIIVNKLTGFPASTENLNKKIFSIYPNPTHSSINIDFNSENNKNEIKIVDLVGKVVFEKTVIMSANNKKIIISLNDFSSGIYFLLINQEGKTSSTKIIKQ